MGTEVINIVKKEMKTQKPTTQVKSCIDFRTWSSIISYLNINQNLQPGDFSLDTRAGASINSSQSAVGINIFINIDHETCGRYAAVGDDSQGTHKKNMQTQEGILKASNPSVEYHSHLLPVDDKRHDCEAVALIAGNPENVKAAFETIQKLGLSNNCDIIARTNGLSTKDKTIWNISDDINEKGDLPISLDLHHPKRILIFAEDEKNATMLLEKAKDIAGSIIIDVQVLLKSV